MARPRHAEQPTVQLAPLLLLVLPAVHHGGADPPGQPLGGPGAVAPQTTLGAPFHAAGASGLVADLFEVDTAVLGTAALLVVVGCLFGWLSPETYRRSSALP